MAVSPPFLQATPLLSSLPPSHSFHCPKYVLTEDEMHNVATSLTLVVTQFINMLSHNMLTDQNVMYAYSNAQISQFSFRPILTNIFSWESREMKTIWSKSLNKIVAIKFPSMVDIICRTGPSIAFLASGFPAALFPWLLRPHRFLQGASCHGNALQSIVQLAGPSKWWDDLGIKRSVFIYLLCEAKEMTCSKF